MAGSNSALAISNRASTRASPDSAKPSLAKSAACTESGHFFKHPARVLIGRLLRSFLDANRITPSELLYSAAYQRKLYNAGSTLEAAVQAASIAQTRDTPVKVTTRIKLLHALIDDVVAQTKEDDRSFRTHKLDRDSCVAQLIQEIQGLRGPELRFRAQRLIIRYLEPCDSWREKFEALLLLIETLARSPDTRRGIALVDITLGEALRSRVALDKLLGPVSTLRQRIDDACEIAQGQLAPRASMAAANLVERLSSAFRSHSLVASRAGLDYHVRTALAGRTHLSSPDLLDELQALAATRGAIQLSNGYVGGDQAPELIERRIMRTLSLGGIGDTLRQLPDKAAEIQALLEIHDALSGALNKRLVCDYIDYVIEDRNLLEKIAEAGDDNGIRALGKIFDLFEASDLAESHKYRLCTLIRDAQSTYLQERRFFIDLVSAPRDPSARALYLMRLCADAAFIPGRNLDAARQLIARLIMDDGFLPSYLQDAKDAAQRDKKINQLKARLLEAGVDEAII